MKNLFFLLLLLGGAAFSQPMSHYKYVIVPAKFDAQKKPGQFGLNNLTKLFLEKNGYTVFFDNDILPANVSNESCNKIYVNVFDDNTIRKTRLRVEIKDCRNAVLFVSQYGESIEKDNNVAFNQALRAAFKSFEKPEYRHDPNHLATQVKVVEAVAPLTQSSETLPASTQVNSKANTETNILSAQKTANGYQLVNMTPQIVLRLFVTSQADIFIAEGEGRSGIVIRKAGQWFFEYYANNQLVVAPLNIKF
jgi:hypothetical protein